MYVLGVPAEELEAHAPLLRFRANMVHTSQSRPYSGLGFQANVLETF